jgi:hypothetical protein
MSARADSADHTSGVQVMVCQFDGQRRKLVHCDFSEVPGGMTWKRVLRQLLAKAQFKFQDTELDRHRRD